MSVSSAATTGSGTTADNLRSILHRRRVRGVATSRAAAEGHGSGNGGVASVASGGKDATVTPPAPHPAVAGAGQGVSGAASDGYVQPTRRSTSPASVGSGSGSQPAEVDAGGCEGGSPGGDTASGEEAADMVSSKLADRAGVSLRRLGDLTPIDPPRTHAESEARLKAFQPPDDQPAQVATGHRTLSPHSQRLLQAAASATSPSSPLPPGSPAYGGSVFPPPVAATGADLPALRVNTAVEATLAQLQAVLSVMLVPTTVLALRQATPPPPSPSAVVTPSWVAKSLKLLPSARAFQLAPRRLHHFTSPLSGPPVPPDVSVPPSPASSVSAAGSSSTAMSASSVVTVWVTDVVAVHCSTSAAHQVMCHQVALTLSSQSAPLHIRFGDKLLRHRWVAGLALLRDLSPLPPAT